MAERVRLVIWDLDETFWGGTLTEGGITLRDDTKAIVVELARRGIVSAICSKNDEARVKEILIAEGLWDYFVLPSINWQPKGPRIAAIIETAQLRPATVLFLDDNPLQLEEARQFVPDLQTESHEFIPAMLDHPLLLGKDDRDLTRLKQYKMLEARKADEGEAKGDVQAFLKGSDIRVRFDFVVTDKIDRAVELINRTNQLNFTKSRLPEDADQARQTLLTQLANHELRVALVGVRDRYGDHGWCGFYALHNDGSLKHFTFSCRILGLGVERWLYERLGQPRIDIKGEVLTDLRSGPAIDWITLETTRGDDAQPLGHISRVVARGGCDLMPVAHYFSSIASKVVGEFNENRWGLDQRIDHSAFLAQALRGGIGVACSASRRLGYKDQDFDSALFKDQQDKEVWLLSFWTDAAYVLYRHKTFGFDVPFAVAGHHFHDARGLHDGDLIPTQRNGPVLDAIKSLKSDYDFLGSRSEQDYKATLRQTFAAARPDAHVFVLLANEYVVDGDGAGVIAESTPPFNAWTRSVAADFPNVRILNIRDFVEHEDEVHDLYHFDRIVYFRLFQHISTLLERGLEGSEVEPWALHVRANDAEALRADHSASVLSRTALFLLRAGSTDLAMDLARRAVELEPGNRTHKLALLRAAVRKGDVVSLEAIGDIIPIDSLPAGVLHEIGVTFMGCGRLSPAEAVFRKAAERQPGELHHRHRLANVLEAAGRRLEAYEVFAACLRDGDTNLHVMAHAASLLITLGRLPEARRFLDTCMALDQDFKPFKLAYEALDRAQMTQAAS